MGATITNKGLASATARAAEMAKRLEDMSPALRVIGAEIVKRTDDAFRSGRSPSGQEFPPLAQSTLEKRARAAKGANRRTKKGDLTKGATRARAKVMAPGGAKPMVLTGNAQNSQRFEIRGPHLLVWSAAAYLKPSISGGQRNGRTGRPPKRNVTVFEHGAGGLGLSIFSGTSAGWRMNDSMSEFSRAAIIAYVRGGEAALGALKW